MNTRDKFGIERISRAKSLNMRPVIGKESSAVTQSSAADNRRALRKSTRSLGYIIDQSGNELECTLHDLSSTGAKATLNLGPRKPFEATPSIPPTFRLVIVQDGIEVDAKLAWTRANTFGIHFESTFRPASLSALARM
jgi:hypothetical protein